MSAAYEDGKAVIEAPEDEMEFLLEAVSAEANEARGKRRKLLDNLADRTEGAVGQRAANATAARPGPARLRPASRPPPARAGRARGR